MWPNAHNKIDQLRHFSGYSAVALSVFTLLCDPSPDVSSSCKTETQFPTKQLLPISFPLPLLAILNFLTTTHYSIVWKNCVVSKLPPWWTSILFPVWVPQTSLQRLYFALCVCCQSIYWFHKRHRPAALRQAPSCSRNHGFQKTGVASSRMQATSIPVEGNRKKTPKWKDTRNVMWDSRGARPTHRKRGHVDIRIIFSWRQLKSNQCRKMPSQTIRYVV